MLYVPLHIFTFIILTLVALTSIYSIRLNEIISPDWRITFFTWYQIYYWYIIYCRPSVFQTPIY